MNFEIGSHSDLHQLVYNQSREDFKEDLYNKKHHIGAIFVLLSTICSFILGYLYYYKALSNSKSTTLVALITYVIPIFLIALLSYLILDEKFSIIVNQGPGSFSGIRISLAIAKGLVIAKKIRLS